MNQSTPAYERLRQQMFVLVCLGLVVSGVFGLFGLGYDPRVAKPMQLLLSLAAISASWTLIAIYVFRVPFIKLERSFVWFFLAHFFLRLIVETWSKDLQIGEFELFTDTGVVMLMLGMFIALPIKEALDYSLLLFFGFLLIPWSAVIFAEKSQPPLSALLFRHQLLTGLIMGLIYVLGVSKSEWYREQARSQMLHDIAHQDTLTGVANRRWLLEQVKQLTSSYALIMFDLDSFKQINDQHGHDMGDTALQQAALLAKHQLRETDLIARWGGEEFLIVLPNASLEVAKGVAERIRLSFLETKAPAFTASFGVATAEKDEFDSSLKKADAALYQAKNTGRNQVMV